MKDQEIQSAREWLLSNRDLIAPFITGVTESHPALWVGKVLESIVASIDQQNDIAIEFGCRYLIHDPKAPFGRMFKRRCMNALRRNADRIPSRFHRALVKAHARMGALPFIPGEYGDLGRLIRALGRSGSGAGPGKPA